MWIPLDDDEFAVDGIEADRKLLSAKKTRPGSCLPGRVNFMSKPLSEQAAESVRQLVARTTSWS